MKEAMARLKDVVEHLQPSLEFYGRHFVNVIIATPFRAPYIYRAAVPPKDRSTKHAIQDAIEVAYLQKGILSKDSYEEAKEQVQTMVDHIFKYEDKSLSMDPISKVFTNVTLTRGAPAYISVVLEPVFQETEALAFDRFGISLKTKNIKVSVTSSDCDVPLFREGTEDKPLRASAIVPLITRKLEDYLSEQDPNTRRFIEALEAYSFFMSFSTSILLDMNADRSLELPRPKTYELQYEKLRLRIDLF